MCELPADEPGHVYHVYVVRSPERDRIREHLAASEIAAATYYDTPLHRQPALRQFGQAGHMHQGERVAIRGFLGGSQKAFARRQPCLGISAGTRRARTGPPQVLHGAWKTSFSRASRARAPPPAGGRSPLARCRAPPGYAR